MAVINHSTFAEKKPSLPLKISRQRDDLAQRDIDGVEGVVIQGELTPVRDLTRHTKFTS